MSKKKAAVAERLEQRQDDEPEIESLFVEQAEYLEDAQFTGWTVQHPHEGAILRKLRAGGAKLILGPRGSGKTTLLKKAYYKMLHDRRAEVLPVYVNFKTSLRLEPIYKTNANAPFWFSQWLYLRTIDGMINALDELGFDNQAVASLDRKSITSIIESLQVSRLDEARQKLSDSITHSEFSLTVARALKLSGRRRMVLLFDDAGHAFSSEQQRDFFDFFRTVKAPEVAPKAAIYPGITDFSSTFHSGHDAEEISVWLDPADDGYLRFMEQLLEKRLPDDVFRRLKSSQDVLALLSLAAFGIPRNLLNMVRYILTKEDEEAPPNRRKAAINKTTALKAVTACANTSVQIFVSLKEKLPIYGRFIDQGNQMLRRSVQQVKNFNNVTRGAKSVTLAIAAPLAPEAKTLLSFFQYAGLVRPRGNVSRGKDGVYDLFDIHYALLIDANAVLAQRSAALSDLSTALTKRSASAITRVTTERLLDAPDIAAALPLMLPPCPRCTTPRATPSARFCLQCGHPLTLASTFETAVNQDIHVLPLTPNRVQSIRTQSTIRTVKDILLDKDHKQLLQVRMIGPTWATRIARYAEEFLE
ncbi:hypothetical protein [Burkholderia gladioli]|uniref:ORC-CDC6 family AAA ATPase n=1 Tax=Burkholderia gladioli TaxID=28095 RepID=UPI0011B284F9|nr:hypothetical protein [Burkholderia gladioli]